MLRSSFHVKSVICGYHHCAQRTACELIVQHLLLQQPRIQAFDPLQEPAIVLQQPVDGVLLAVPDVALNVPQMRKQLFDKMQHAVKSRMVQFVELLAGEHVTHCELET